MSIEILRKIDSLNITRDLEIQYNLFAWQEHCASYWNDYILAYQSIKAIKSLPLDSIPSLQKNNELIWMKTIEGNLLIEMGDLKSSFDLFNNLAKEIKIESLEDSEDAQIYRIIYLYLATIEKKRKNYNKSEVLYKYVIEAEKKLSLSQNRSPVIETNLGRLADVQRLQGNANDCLRNSLIAFDKYKELRSQNKSNNEFYLKDLIRIMYVVYECDQMMIDQNHSYLFDELMTHMESGLPGISRVLFLKFEDILKEDNLDKAVEFINQFTNDNSLLSPLSTINLNNRIGNEIYNRGDYISALERFNSSLNILDTIGYLNLNNKDVLYNHLSTLLGLVKSNLEVNKAKFREIAKDAFLLFQAYKDAFLFDEEGLLKLEEFDMLYEYYLESLCTQPIVDYNELFKVLEGRSKNILHKQVVLSRMSYEQNENVTELLLTKKQLNEFRKNDIDSISLSNLRDLERALIIALNDDIKLNFSKSLPLNILRNDNTNYVYYFFTNTSFYSIVFKGSGEINLQNLGEKCLFIDLLKATSYELGSSLEKESSTRFHELYVKLIMPLNITFGEEILIMPIPGIGQLPFGAFLVNELDRNSFLEKYYTINYQNSIALNNELQKRKYNTNGAAFLAPFSTNKEEYILSSAHNLNDTFTLDKLENAKREATLLSELYSGDLLCSSKSNTLSALKKDRVIHYAGHVLSNIGENAEEIMLVLSNDLRLDSSSLSLDEIYGLKCESEMIVLSACNTGSGLVVSGEGVLSLSRGFFYAGAKSVISTLWSINDQSSAFIMTEFYKELKKGKRKDEALRQAKLTYLHQADPEYQHPYYWAAFIAMGDMSPLFFPYRKYKIGGVALGSILILGLAFRKNRQLQVAA